MKAIPLTKATIDWPTFISATKQAFDRALTKELDKRNMPLNDYGYLTALKEMKQEGFDPSKTLDETEIVTKHLFYSFIFILPQHAYIRLLEESSLFIYASRCKNDYIFSIVSGTFDLWIKDITKFVKASDALGIVFTTCKNHLEKDTWKQKRIQ